MKTQVKFLNGLNTIGGNVVSFVKDNTRIIMDFGVNFDPASNDEIKPNVPDLYNTSSLDEFTNQAIFISHLHIDHIGGLKYLGQKLPIYMSNDSKKLYEKLIESGDEKLVNNIIGVDYESPVKIGPFTVTFFESDHDIIGASAIQILDGEHNFVYSGDVRYNGPAPKRVDSWISKVTKVPVDLLLIEGTSFSFDDETTTNSEHEYSKNVEQKLQDNFAKTLSEERPIIINPYPRNVERLFALEKTALENERPLIWEPFYADILDTFFPNDSRLVFGKNIDLNYLNNNFEKYVAQISFENLSALSELPNALYLHMNGEPLGDYDPRYQIMMTVLENYGAEFKYMGASGHAEKEDLVKIAKLINAVTTVPWHSFKPEIEAKAFKENGINIYLPSEGETIEY
jgi:ribonuclease J